MLVVIVVAAATAFSFFVAAYQKQLQGQETLEHNKALEKLRILGLEPAVSAKHPPVLSSITLELASLDVNPIAVTGLLLGGDAVVEYNVTSSSGLPLATGCLNGNPYVAANTSCFLGLPAESQIFLQLDINPRDSPNQSYSLLPNVEADLTESSVLDFEVLTSLGNSFTQSFVPPVAIAGITFVTSFPILDGSNSYQPAESGSSNSTIDFWIWNVAANPLSNCSNDCGPWSGQEVELPNQFAPSTTYTISLTVVNTESLVATAQIDYVVPA